MTVHLQRWPLSVDPLIGEAKQRMRRRRLLVAVLAGLMALAIGLTLAMRSSGPPSVSGVSSRWVPQGVTEIDAHASNSPFGAGRASPPISLRVTDPDQVAQIAALFNGLTRNTHLTATATCQGGPALTVGFTFRGASGDRLATANSAPAPTGRCDPIQLDVGAQPEKFLYDASRYHSLIRRVEQLLGVKFQLWLFYG